MDVSHEPPDTGGLPLLGDTVPLLTDTLNYIERRRRRYGNIWATRFMGQRVAVALGVEAQRAVLENNAQFPAAPGYSFVKPLLRHSLFDMDGEEHREQRAFLTPAFSGRHYPTYIERIDRVLDRIFTSWGTSGRRVFHHDALAAMFAISCSIAASIEIGDDYEEFFAHWQAMQQGLLNPLRVNLWGTPWQRSLTSRRWLEGALRKIIIQRRTQLSDMRTLPSNDNADGGGVDAQSLISRSDTTDILGLLLEAQREEQARGGEMTLTDDQIIDHVILLLFAGYETAAGAVSWLLVELLRHPMDILPQVRDELHADDSVAYDRALALADFRATPYVDAVIKETLRLHPAQHLSIRGVAEPWSFAGTTIPAGWGVIITPLWTHRAADYFTNSDRFDPDRFLSPREEDRKTPYALIEFGGGAHACLGSGIAKLFMKAILAKLLRRFDLELAPQQDFTPIFIPTGRPKGGAIIQYRQRGAVKATRPVEMRPGRHELQH